MSGIPLGCSVQKPLNCSVPPISCFDKSQRREDEEDEKGDDTEDENDDEDDDGYSE